MSSITYFFFDRKSNSLGLAFFRIGIALVAITIFFSVSLDSDFFYDGLDSLHLDLTEILSNSDNNYLRDLQEWWHVNNIPFSAVQVISIFYCSFLLTLLLGFYSNISALFAAIIHTGFVNISHNYSYGVDFFISTSLFYCIFFPVGKRLSVTNFYRKKRSENSLLDTFSIRIIQIHLCFIYFSSGVGKMVGLNWWNGESVWKAIHLPYFNQDFELRLNSLAYSEWLFVFSGIIVVLIEFLFPFFQLNPRLRAIIFFSTISLHIGIAIFLNLYFFSAIMIIWNLAVYVALIEPKIKICIKS